MIMNAPAQYQEAVIPPDARATAPEPDKPIVKIPDTTNDSGNTTRGPIINGSHYFDLSMYRLLGPERAWRPSVTFGRDFKQPTPKRIGGKTAEERMETARYKMAHPGRTY